jgi:hypothetical protein
MKEAKMKKEMILSLTEWEVQLLEDGLSSLMDSGYADEFDSEVMKMVSDLKEKLYDISDNSGT